ncbi:MAG: alpha/beta fold hydrolase [Ardenticatenia bacterium]|nr:alpha/beta fold hydrolase [Ardenticatenia bacterium]
MTVPTADGWRLRAEAVVPPHCEAALVVGHAMMTNRQRMDWPPGRGLVSTLAQHGFAVLNADLRGHGESTPHASRRVDWSYDELVFQDTPALITFARERWPGVPLALVGHSLFGHVAAAHVAMCPDTPVQALVGLAANVWLRHLEPDRRRWWRKRLYAEVVACIVALFGYAPVRLLRQGTDDEAATYFRQLVGWIRSGWWTTLDGRDYLAALRSARIPALNVVGARDTFLCAPENAARMWAYWGGPFEQWVIDHIWGLRYVPGHMGIAMNPACRSVWHRVAAWLRASLGLEAASA